MIRRNFGGRGGLVLNNNNKNGRRRADIKKTLGYFTFYIGSKKQSRDYENTALFVINHTKKDFDRGKNISETLW